MNGFEILRRLLRPLVFSYVRPRLEGLHRVPEQGPALLAGNHPNLLDGVILALASPRPIRFLVAGEIFENPVTGAFLRWAGCVPVDRRGGSNRPAMQAAEAALGRGELVGLFPEGRTNNGGALLDLRPGVALLALQTGAPVIPFGVAGTERLLPWGSKLVRPGTVALTVGLPLPATRDGRDPVPPRRVERFLARIRKTLVRQVLRASRLLEGTAPRPCRPPLPAVTMEAPT